MVEDLIAELAATFVDLPPGARDESMRAALESVGTAFRVDRSTLYLRSGRDPEFTWTCDWSADGIPQAGGPDTVLCRSGEPWLMEKLEKLEVLAIRRVSELPAEAAAEVELLGKRGARGAALVPLVSRGSLIGILALEAVRREISWTKRQIGMLRVVGDLLVGAIERLRSEDSRRHTEERLREAQRLEVLGRIAGGVAHDFNNFLTAIIGNCELAAQQTLEAEPALEEIGEIRLAAERASTLVDRILSFSHRRSSQPRPLDLGWLVVDMEKLIRCVVGGGIELVTDLPDEPGLVRADPGALEQVIVNLVVNARDAMREGGRLSIRVRDVEVGEHPPAYLPEQTRPGSYVALMVCDTGCGMNAETRARLFEPNFTTKGPGRGTGLGLTSVLGIIRDGGGAVGVESQPGRGSTFSILLPRIESLPAAPASRGETILVVEEEPAARQRLLRTFEHHGYGVLEAADDAAAAELCRRHPGPIDLLVTDLALPHLRGSALASTLRLLRPEMKVLYTSRYPQAAVRGDGILEGDASMVEKPFTPHCLAYRAREKLDDLSGEARRTVISSERRIPRMPDVTSPHHRELRVHHEADGKSLGA
jgi:signal transduction histidine kinase/CheY-like chemotaxis protein